MNTLNSIAGAKVTGSVRESTRTDHAFRDVPDLGHETKDVLKQLQANLSCLEDLGGRLEFTLREVRSLIKRK